MSGMEAKSANALAKLEEREGVGVESESIRFGGPLTVLAYERKARELGFSFDALPPGEPWRTGAERLTG